MLEIRLLGQYGVLLDGEPVTIRSRPAKTLLAYLVLTRGTHHPRERLAGLLWPDSSEANARKNLRQALWRLRKEIGDAYLQVDSVSVAFDGTLDFWLDAATLELSPDGDLETAVSAFKGELLPGYYEDWVQLERDRLTALFERRMERFVSQLLQEERWSDAGRWAEHWIAQGQTPEAAYRALMLTHAATGELAKVEEAYRRCAETLQSEVGVDPSEETQELYQQLLAGTPVSAYRLGESADPSRERKLNLPAQPTAFIGRAAEIDECERLLSEARLLTLIGPGGIGKTRLALKLAGDLAGQFSGGAHFVNLAAIDAVHDITQTIADTLEFPLATQAEPDDQLLRYLRNKQLLLVMDNFEHLLEGADMVSRILRAASEVKVLATSREKLGLQGEVSFAVTGMGLPEQDPAVEQRDHDAIELFVQSAQRAFPGFSPSEQELSEVTRICRMVQGMPLAIELAAAWLDTLSLGEIEAELRRSLNILSTGKRDIPDRHRNIRAAFDHSWSLIEQEEQTVFMRLSVFRGGFTRAAANQVAGASLDLLAALVGKSLVRHDSKSGRFEVHELMRQYATEKLEQDPEASASAHEAHAGFYASLMEARWDHLRDDRQKAALAEIDADIENIRSAWRHSLGKGDLSCTRKFLHSLWLVYTVHGWNYAGDKLFGGAADRLREIQDNEAAEVQTAIAMGHQGFFLAWLGLAERGLELSRESAQTLRRLKRPPDLSLVLYDQNLCAQYLDLHAEQEQTAREMLQIARERNDAWLEALSLFPLSTAMVQQHDLVSAKEFSQQSLKISEAIGDSIIALYNLLVLGHIAFNAGNHEGARADYLRSLSMSEELGFRWAIENASKYLGIVALAVGEVDLAERYFQQSLMIADEIGLGRDMVNLAYEFARLRVVQDRREQAIELLALVREHPASRQARFGEGPIQDNAQKQLDKLESEVPSEAFAAAVERGRTLELDDAVAALIAKGSLITAR